MMPQTTYLHKVEDLAVFRFYGFNIRVENIKGLTSQLHKILVLIINGLITQLHRVDDTLYQNRNGYQTKYLHKVGRLKSSVLWF